MSTVVTPKNWEDYLTYFVTIAVALAGFNWASLIPGDNNAFLVAAAFGVLAKLLVGAKQNGWKSWEDWIPTVTISLGFLATTLSSNPEYLTYGTVIGFIIKALGYFADKSNPIEDLLLAVGAFLALYGQYVNNNEIIAAGALFALVGKTIPSMGPQTPTTTSTTTPTTIPVVTPTSGGT